MTVQEMIEQMGERVFDQPFQDYLSATCQTLPGMNFLTEEDGYKASMNRFTSTIGQPELEALKQIEGNYGEEFKYATLFAFRAGLYSGLLRMDLKNALRTDSSNCLVCSGTRCFSRSGKRV